MAEIIGAAVSISAAASYITGRFLSAREKIIIDQINPKCLQNNKLSPIIIPILVDSLDSISDEALLITIRQLDFFYTHASLTKEEFLNLAERLLEEARCVLHNDLSIPKVRFGWTEIQMPVVTCDEFTKNRLKDFLFRVKPPGKMLEAIPQQDSLRDISLKLLDLGVVYIELSQLQHAFEMRLMHTISMMIQNEEIKREDVIIHLKMPPRKTRIEFEKNLSKLWNEHLNKLDFIDLFSFHIVGKNYETDWVLDKKDDMCYAAAVEFQNEGKIRSIGFSTDRSVENTMRLICSNNFEYVNLYYHFLGREICGHENFSNLTCIKKALDLDMGVLSFSPFTRGGMLYKASKTCILTMSEKISPLSYAILQSWEAGIHSSIINSGNMISIIDAPENVDLSSPGKIDSFIKVQERMIVILKSKLCEEWFQKGLLNLPSYQDKVSHGVDISYILWLHNLLITFGLFDFCKKHYKILEANKSVWNNKISFEENIKHMNSYGRSYQHDVDYSDALSQHYNPSLALIKINECHDLLNERSKVSMEQINKNGWNVAKEFRANGEHSKEEAILMRKLIKSYLDLNNEKGQNVEFYG